MGLRLGHAALICAVLAVVATDSATGQSSDERFEPQQREFASPPSESPRATPRRTGEPKASTRKGTAAGQPPARQTGQSAKNPPARKQPAKSQSAKGPPAKSQPAQSQPPRAASPPSSHRRLRPVQRRPRMSRSPPRVRRSTCRNPRHRRRHIRRMSPTKSWRCASPAMERTGDRRFPRHHRSPLNRRPSSCSSSR
jgi:hypothetical protein